MLRNLILTYAIILNLVSYGQERHIHGKVISASGKAIERATIVLKTKNSDLALAYTATNELGEFKIISNNKPQTNDTFIEISHLSYKRKRISLETNVWQYQITLEESPITLDSISIKSKPKVLQKKDTITYKVDGFSRNDDRSIGDVLKRIPGIEVGENGEIRFNNRPITHFYIDGDDLLGGKYGIGTKTIPHDMVENIQVLTNHEHIKVKRDPYTSNNVALNLEIKDDVKLKMKGIAKIGAGLPKKHASEVNTILLNKQFKMLNSIKGNNIGEDISMDVFDIINNRIGNDKLINPTTVSVPFISKNRHFINNSGLATANNSHRFNNDLFIRTNLNYLLNKNKLSFNGITRIYTQTDTISLQEQQEGTNLSHSADVDLYAELNKPLYYLKNDLKLNYQKENVISDIYNDQIGFSQSLRNNSHSFSNRLNYIPILRNRNLLEFDWTMKVNNSPQKLNINPGIFSDVINNGIPYEQLDQYANKFIFSNSIVTNYRLQERKIEQNYGITFKNVHQSLRSQINFLDSTGILNAYENGSNNNDLNWDEYSTYIYTGYRYKKNKLQATLNMPLRFSYVTYKDTVFKQQNTNSFWFIEPNMSFEYQLNPQDRLLVAYNVSNSINGITDIYQGYILLNHRTFQRNEYFNLFTQRNHRWQLDYNFKRPIKMVFGNIAANYSITNRDILNTVVFEDGLQKQMQIPYSNKIRTGEIYAGLSKYIFLLGTTVAIKARWINTQLKESINDKLYDIENNSYRISANLDYELFKKVSISNQLDMTRSNNTYQEQANNNISFISNNQIKNSLIITYSPLSNVHLRSSMQSVHIRQKSIENIDLYFIDASVRWKINHWRSEVEFYMYNIADSRSLTTYSIHNNGFINNRYTLNPRILMMKYLFNF